MARGFTLREVSAASRGRFKPSVVGGYERGERSISLERFVELARFYGMPADRLLADALAGLEPDGRGKLVIDLTRLSAIAEEDQRTVSEFVNRVRAQRGDYVGETLTLRSGDVEAMALEARTKPKRLLASLRPATRPAGTSP
jgi:transcriptional regulator with XRE-family HTH domain